MLASSLKEYKGRNPLVLAIPRGAVPMEHVIAESLDGEMNIVLVHRLGAPFSTEFTTGAIDETGWTYIASFAQQFGASGSFLEEEKCRLLKVLKRRRAQDSLEQVAPLVDDTVCLCTPAHFLAVGQFFRNFSEVGDDEVIQILSQHHKADKPGPSSAH